MKALSSILSTLVALALNSNNDSNSNDWTTVSTIMGKVKIQVQFWGGWGKKKHVSIWIAVERKIEDERRSSRKEKKKGSDQWGLYSSMVFLTIEIHLFVGLLVCWFVIFGVWVVDENNRISSVLWWVTSISLDTTLCQSNSNHWERRSNGHR